MNNEVNERAERERAESEWAARERAERLERAEIELRVNGLRDRESERA